MSDQYTQSIYHQDAPGGEPAENSIPSGRVTVRKNNDGTETLVGPDGSEHNIGNPAQAIAEKTASASNGRALLEELRARSYALIEEHEIEGRNWYLLKMGRDQVNEVAVRTLALGDGTLLLTNPQVMRAFTLATIQAAVVSGPKDPSPFFNPNPYMQEDAFGNVAEMTELAVAIQEPAFAPTAAVLFDKLTDINPAIFPQKKMLEEAWEKVTKPSTPKPSAAGSLNRAAKRRSQQQS